MKILTAAEMAVCDRVTSECFGISQWALMQAAGDAVARFALRHFVRAQRVTVLCGRGNNGGDGMVAARELARAGRMVTVVLLGDPNGLRAEPARLWSELEDVPGVTRSVFPENTAQNDGMTELPNAELRDADLIVDAVTGTGFRPPLRGPALALAAALRTATVPVLAVDLPTGWDADAATCTMAFPADAIVTFTAPKPAHVLGHLTRRWSDPVVVAQIGSPAEAVVTTSGLLWAGSAKSLVEAARSIDAHKGSFGHVLLVGGSVGKAGAVAMAAMAALRSGAGLVTVSTPAAVQAQVAACAPEMMTMPLDADARALLERKTVVAIGPGMGTSAWAREALWRLLNGQENDAVPIVLDADALNLLSAEPGSVKSLAQRHKLVLTPHPGEMARLTGLTVAEIEQDRVGVARRFAQEHGVTLVLKGSRTLVAHADGQVAVNTTGNPGMAKGGSGDVLTGILAAMLAQFPDKISEAVEAAVCLHGMAGDMAARRLNEHSMLATDTIASLSRAFPLRLVEEDGWAHGWTWLQGAVFRRKPSRRMPSGRMRTP